MTYRVTKVLQGTSGGQVVQAPAQSIPNWIIPSKALSTQVLKSSKDRDSTTPLGSLFQCCSTTLLVRKILPNI